MNKKILYLTVLLCYGLSMQFTYAQVTQVSKIMAQYEDVFFNKIEAISTDYNNGISTIDSQYTETLQKYMQIMQNRGSLYEVRAAQAELTRFTANKTLVIKNINQEFESLKKVQFAFIDKLETINYERAKAIVDIYSRMISALDKYKAQLTREGNINDAQWVDEKRKEFEISRVYKQAQTSIKIYEITHDIKDFVEPVEDVDETEPQTDVENSANDREFDESTLVIDPEIHGSINIDFSTTFPNEHIKEYKRMGLTTRTDVNSSALSVISFVKTLTNEEKGTCPWAMKLRFQINSLTSKKDYNDCFIVVQYFGSYKIERRQSHRTLVENLGFQIVQIPAPLTNSRMFLDLPAFPKIESDHWNTTSYLMPKDFNAYNFYGVIVSIYDENNDLIYQKCSIDGLRSLARSRPPVAFNHIRNPKNFKIRAINTID